MDSKSIIERMGFEECEFEPDSTDFCERCGELPKDKIYFRGEPEDGEYWCKKCIIESYNSEEINERILEELDFLKNGIQKIISQKREIFVEGNNGGNHIKITQLDNHKLYLEVGHCCTIPISVELTAEAFSSLLVGILFEKNKDFLEIVRDYMEWDKKTNEEFFKGCKKINNLQPDLKIENIVTDGFGKIQSIMVTKDGEEYYMKPMI